MSEVDQLPVPSSGKRRLKLSLEQATEAIVLVDKIHGRIAVPTTPDGNRNYQLYMVSVIREAGKALLDQAKKDKFKGFSMQQFKQYAEAMKIAGDMAYEAFRNPEDPSNDIPKESSPLKGIMSKLIGSAETLTNTSSTPQEQEKALEDIELVTEEINDKLDKAEHVGESEES